MNFLATNSLPEPVGPEINILLSDDDNFSVVFLTLIKDGLLQLNQKNEIIYFQ